MSDERKPFDASLRAAAEPDEIDPIDHELLLAMSLRTGYALPDEELADAAALREALAGRGEHALAELALSLRSAAMEHELAAADGEALLALALSRAPDLDGELEAERIEAERLAAAMGGRGAHPLAELAASLRAACGGEIDRLGLERALRRALTTRVRPRPGVVLGALAAIAAGIALFLGSMWNAPPSGPVSRQPEAPENAAAVLVRARSTQELFDPATPFAARGGESERLDQIARARAADLRRNRFARWGVE